jgi:predicted Zn-dependent protease
MPDEQMAELGAQAFTQIQQETPVATSGTEVRYVDCIADSITKVLPPEYQGQWDVRVFQSDQVNAFALPGRKIGVYMGLLKVATNQDMVATVIGHEVGHVLARHGNERVSQNVVLQSGMSAAQAFAGGSTVQKHAIMAAIGAGAQYGIVLPHSRTQETEADRIGLDLMAKAGFEPEQSVELWRNMDKAAGGNAPPEWLSTHPANASRIKDLESGMAKAKQEQQAANAAGLRPQCGGSGVASVR